MAWKKKRKRGGYKNRNESNLKKNYHTPAYYPSFENKKKIEKRLKVKRKLSDNF